MQLFARDVTDDTSGVTSGGVRVFTLQAQADAYYDSVRSILNTKQALLDQLGLHTEGQHPT